MKNIFYFVFVLCSLACSEDSEVPSRSSLEDFYVNLYIGSDTVQLNEETCDITKGQKFSGCIDSFTYGMQYTNIISKHEINGFIRSLSIGILRKVSFGDLGAPTEIGPGVTRSFVADSLRYMREVLYNQNFGASYATALPASGISGSVVRDSINKSILAEAFLTLEIRDKRFRSFSDGLIERNEDSYFQIDQVVKLSESDTRGYSYTIEGTFKIDMYYNEEKSFVIVEGDFRLPVYSYHTDQALAECD